MIAQSLKSRNASYRLTRARLDMIDIVVVEDTKVWWWDVGVVRVAEAATGVGDAFCCMSVVCYTSA